jgi:DUF4097 and DUF4098 domain-containing protein YvlB
MLTQSSILRFSLALVVLAPAAALAQRSDAEWLEDCRDDRSDRRDRREVFCEVRETRVRLSSGSTVAVEGLRNGGITAVGWDRDSLVVKTRIRAQAETEREARELASEVRTTVSGGTISVDGPRSRDGDSYWTASIVASVPQRSNLRLQTSNGPVSVERVTGTHDVRTSNGPLSLRALAGEVRARTTNGPLSITLAGTKWDGAGLDAQTTNGPLTITVPENYNARLETGTRNGPVRVDFPITVVGRITRDINTTLGSGGATIRATTTNGPLTLKRD